MAQLLLELHCHLTICTSSSFQYRCKPNSVKMFSKAQILKLITKSKEFSTCKAKLNFLISGEQTHLKTVLKDNFFTQFDTVVQNTKLYPLLFNFFAQNGRALYFSKIVKIVVYVHFHAILLVMCFQNSPWHLSIKFDEIEEYRLQTY